MADKFQGDVVPVEAGFLNYLLREPVGVVGQVVPWNFPLMFTSWKMAPALAAGNCHRAEAGRDHAAVDAEDRRADERGRPARRRRQHRAGPRAASPDSTSPNTRRRQDRLHRQHRDRPAHRAGERRQPEEGAARARRQGRQHRVRRRQPRRGGQRQRLGDLPQPGPGLHRRLAADAARAHRRRVPREVRGAGEVDPPGQPARRRHRDGPADERAAPRPRAGLRGRRARAGRRGDRAAARRRRRRSSRRAATSSRRSCARAATRDRIAQEEVFGPFVTVLTFKDDAEALAIANSTDYGLGSGLWTRNLQRAHQVARELHAGMVWINSYKRVNPGSPFGGVGPERATAARWASTRCASTRRSRASGSTSMRRFRRGIRAEAVDPTAHARALRLHRPRPSRVVFGAGALQHLAREIDALGAQRALVLSTPEQAASAAARRRAARRRAPPASSPQAVMHVPIETAREARDEARAARRRLRRRDRRRLDHRARQGDRARLGPADRRHPDHLRRQRDDADLRPHRRRRRRRPAAIRACCRGR